jgi:regulator of protease activity HflC (stomatin/prohibitin superfamily)
MVMLILAAICVVLGFIVSGVWNYIRSEAARKRAADAQRDNYGRANPPKIEVMIPPPVHLPRWLGFGIGALFAISSMFAVVPAGHVGVVTLFGKVERWTLSEGFHLVNPLVRVTNMSAQIQVSQGGYDGASADMQTVHTQFAMNYRLLPDKAAEVFQKVGLGYEATIIGPAAQESLKAVLAQHRAAEILHARHAIKSDVQERLSVWLRKYGVELKECSIINIAFDKEYESAIRAKQVQEQQAEQKKYEVLKAQRQAEITQANALGDANAAREAAKGAADALQVRGEAEAEYNKKVSESLSAILVQQQYLTRWDGKLPQYMMGESGSTLLQLPGAK